MVMSANQGGFPTIFTSRNNIIYETTSNQDQTDQGAVERIFVATADTLSFSATDFNNVRRYVFTVTLEELTNHEETTDWD